MLNDNEKKELETLTSELNTIPNRALVKRSTIDDIEDAIYDLEEIMKDGSDHVNFICIRAINKLEKAKRQVRDLL
jgi:uncharacterized protein YoxC